MVYIFTCFRIIHMLNTRKSFLSPSCTLTEASQSSESLVTASTVAPLTTLLCSNPLSTPKSPLSLISHPDHVIPKSIIYKKTKWSIIQDMTLPHLPANLSKICHTRYDIVWSLTVFCVDCHPFWCSLDWASRRNGVEQLWACQPHSCFWDFVQTICGAAYPIPKETWLSLLRP